MNPFPTPTLRPGAVLGFLTMVVIGWKLGAETDRPAESQPEIATRSADRPTRANRRGGPPEAVRQRMAALRAIASPTDRLRATLALANSIPVSEIAAWLDGHWFSIGAGFDRTLFTTILKERWQREDPDGLLAWNCKNDPIQARATLNEWAKTDPQRALAYFKDHPQRELELQMLMEMAKTSPALALQALGDLPAAGKSESGMGDYHLRELLEQLAKSSPAALEAALASLPPALRKEADLALIKDRMTTSFPAEIRKLWERPDGWKIFWGLSCDGSKAFAAQLFNELANLPPTWRAELADNPHEFVDSKDAEKWYHADLEGFGFTEAQAKRLRTLAVSELAAKAPAAALKLMAEMDLDSSYRNSIISNLFANFHGSPDEAESLLAQLGSDEERKLARSDLPAARSEQTPPEAEQPADWLAQAGAADLKSGLTDYYQYLSMLRNWDADKIAALGSQFQTLPADQKRQIAQILTQNSGYAQNLNSLAGEAIRYLLANPVPEPKRADPVFDPIAERRHADGTSFTPAVLSPAENATIGQVSELAVNWAENDPTAASGWVQSLPAGEAKGWAQKNLAANWAQVDPEATDRWLSTLPAAERTQVREFMKKSPGSPNR